MFGLDIITKVRLMTAWSILKIIYVVKEKEIKKTCCHVQR